MGHYILHSKDTKLCVVDILADRIQARQAQEKIERLAYALTETHIVENAAKAIKSIKGSEAFN